MKYLKKFSKRYRFFLLLAVVNLLLLAASPADGIHALRITKDNLLEMLRVVPPIFVLLGLLDVWVKKETMIRFMGENSGLLGIVLAFALGAAAAGPLYAAFPVAGILLKKGSRLSNVLIFVFVWGTMKVPQMLFEIQALGLHFSMLRMGLDIISILLMAFLIEKLIPAAEKERIYQGAQRF